MCDKPRATFSPSPFPFPAFPGPAHRKARRRYGSSGFNLVEVMMTLSVVILVFALGVTPVIRWWGSLRLELAAGEIHGALQLARSYAVRHRANVAVRFEVDEDGSIWHSLYRDTNGNGVRNRDIGKGVDVRVQGPAILAKGGIHFGFPSGLKPMDPSTRKPMERLHDPIRFNRSDLASFSSQGTATPGTVYLTDGHDLFAVRVTNQVGRVRVMRYDLRNQRWR